MLPGFSIRRAAVPLVMLVLGISPTAWAQVAIKRGTEQIAVLKLKRLKPLPSGFDERLAQGFLQHMTVEADGVIIVRPVGAGFLGRGIAAGHVGQLAERHPTILGNQVLSRPAFLNPGTDRVVHALELALLDGEKQQRAQDGLGGDP